MVEPFVGCCLPACHTKKKTVIKHVRACTNCRGNKERGREGRRKVSEQHEERTTRAEKEQSKHTTKDEKGQQGNV